MYIDGKKLTLNNLIQEQSVK